MNDLLQLAPLIACDYEVAFFPALLLTVGFYGLRLHGGAHGRIFTFLEAFSIFLQLLLLCIESS